MTDAEHVIKEKSWIVWWKDTDKTVHKVRFYSILDTAALLAAKEVEFGRKNAGSYRDT